jgi:hypothetical protein
MLAVAMEHHLINVHCLQIFAFSYRHDLQTSMSPNMTFILQQIFTCLSPAAAKMSSNIAHLQRNTKIDMNYHFRSEASCTPVVACKLYQNLTSVNGNCDISGAYGQGACLGGR